MSKAIKVIPHWWRDDHLVFRTYHGNIVGDAGPGIRAIDVGILLQGKTCGSRRPGYDHGISAREHYPQQRRACRLYGGNNSPKTAINRIIAPAHMTGIRLADGAADRINPAGAGSSSAINGEPINVVVLCARREGKG